MTITPALRIRVIRAILGDNPGQFAKRLGVHVNTLARWEDGRNTPDLANEIALGELCKQQGIFIRKDGYPFLLFLPHSTVLN